jgi:hypothetical protein
MEVRAMVNPFLSQYVSQMRDVQLEFMVSRTYLDIHRAHLVGDQGYGYGILTVDTEPL